MLKIAYLYTESHLTPWKENVNLETLNFLISKTPEYFNVEIVHFDGFNYLLVEKLKKFDFVINLSYGFMEAGQVDVSKWLDENHILHSSSSVESLTIAQNKSFLPEISMKLGISTPSIFYDPFDLIDDEIYLAKPRLGSCHRNISINSGKWFKLFWGELSPDLIIQPYIVGREFSVAVIPAMNQEEGYLGLPPVEIISKNNSSFFIAGQNYGPTERVFDIDLDSQTKHQIIKAALDLHNHLGLIGMSRSDFRLDMNHSIYILDVNAMPNLDPLNSLLPAICNYQKIPMEFLIDRFIKDVLRKKYNIKVESLNKVNSIRSNIF